MVYPKGTGAASGAGGVLQRKRLSSFIFDSFFDIFVQGLALSFPEK